MNKCHEDFCHEIYNHIQVIAAYAELIQKSTSLKQSQDFAGKISSNIEKLLATCRKERK